MKKYISLFLCLMMLLCTTAQAEDTICPSCGKAYLDTADALSDSILPYNGSISGSDFLVADRETPGMHNRYTYYCNNCKRYASLTGSEACSLVHDEEKHTNSCTECGYSVSTLTPWTATGNNGVWTHERECTVCSLTIAGNCTFSISYVYDAETASYTHRFTCRTCGAGYNDGKTHIPDDADYENVINPTCSQSGECDEVYYCSICGIELSREHKAIPALDSHTPSVAFVENYVAPTCAEEGSMEEVTYCTNCGQEISRTAVVLEKLTSHVRGEVVEENAQEATCTALAQHDEVVYCSICGIEIYRETVETSELLPHTESETVFENIVEATCAEEGSMDEVVYCSVCGIELSRETLAEPMTTEHTAGDPVQENIVLNSCTEDGHYESVTYCSVCEAEMSRELVKLNKTGHRFTQWETKYGDCTHDTVSTRECSYCGVMEKDVDPAPGHCYARIESETPGYYAYACIHDNCKSTLMLRESEDSHTAEPDSAEEPVTCVMQEVKIVSGLTISVCTACGRTDQTDANGETIYLKPVDKATVVWVDELGETRTLDNSVVRCGIVTETTLFTIDMNTDCLQEQDGYLVLPEAISLILPEDFPIPEKYVISVAPLENVAITITAR